MFADNGACTLLDLDIYLAQDLSQTESQILEQFNLQVDKV